MRRFRPKIVKRRRRHSGTVLNLKKSAFALMTDFEKAGIRTSISGKDSYISTRYRFSSKMLEIDCRGRQVDLNFHVLETTPDSATESVPSLGLAWKPWERQR